MSLYSAAKQQSLWIVSLWRSPLTFSWPGVPKDCWLGLIEAPSDGDQNAIGRCMFLQHRQHLLFSQKAWGQFSLVISVFLINANNKNILLNFNSFKLYNHFYLNNPIHNPAYRFLFCFWKAHK